MTSRAILNLGALAVMVGIALANSPTALVTSSPEERAKIEASVTYGGCNEVRELGKAPLYAGEPGYRVTMDGDGDGLACEPIRQ